MPRGKMFGGTSSINAMIYQRGHPSNYDGWAELGNEGWAWEWVQHIYHPVGTCKMGSDPMAVVNNQLQVHGVEGLRVADASIMPCIINANTNNPCIMIGEKCADMILQGQ